LLSKTQAKFSTKKSDEPEAIKRLGSSVFVPQTTHRLGKNKFKVVFIDKKYFKKAGQKINKKFINDFALEVNPTNNYRPSSYVTTYADFQKDKSGLSLSGNLGSGRAVYYKDRYNILGVGKTSLCTGEVPTHNTGNLEIINGMRRIIISRWINAFMPNGAPEHPVLIALNKTERHKWNKNPIPLSLLVRVDDMSLDRPSHVEQNPNIDFDFKNTINQYAKLDAEFFAHRILMGAWSNGNFSLSGHVIDLESVSFVKYRGPYYTSSRKYPHNRFGYEQFGFLDVLHQLADVKNIPCDKIDHQFYEARKKYLALCFLQLLGIDAAKTLEFFFRHESIVLDTALKFETLAKKIAHFKATLSLYAPVEKDTDPTLLDMSALFRNLAKITKSNNTEKKALEILVRKTAIEKVGSSTSDTPLNSAEKFLQDNATISSKQLPTFLNETKKFVHQLLDIVHIMRKENYISDNEEWLEKLHFINQEIPVTAILNKQLTLWAERYRKEKITPSRLEKQIERLCDLPHKTSR
jgi:hypothetical protein